MDGVMVDGLALPAPWYWPAWSQSGLDLRERWRESDGWAFLFAKLVLAIDLLV